MKISAVAVASSNIKETVKFYTLLGFKFENFKEDEQHLEPITPDGSARLMIDSVEMIESILGYKPVPSNHSNFAIEYESAEKVNEAAKKLTDNGYTLTKEPWDAFWGQRYCVAKDPDGYLIDLYAKL